MNKKLLTLLLGTTALSSSIGDTAMARGISIDVHIDGYECVATKSSLYGSFQKQFTFTKKAPKIVPAAPVVTLEEDAKKEKTQGPKKVKTRDWGKKFSGLSKLYGEASENRQELQDMRARHMKTFEALQQDEDADYVSLAADVTADTIAYIQKRVKRLIEKMGPAPCEFSLFSLGSMPRGESGFYTDLEIGILMKHNTVKTRKYFTQLTQRLSDELFLLGEHPDVGGKGLRIDEADNAPMHMRWFARYATPEQARDLLSDALANRTFGERMQIPYEGSRIFLTTPDQLANYSDPDYDWSAKKDSWKQRRAAEERLFKKEFRKALRDRANKGRPRHELTQEVRRYVKDIMSPFNAREINGIQNTRSLLRNIMSLYGSDDIFQDYLKKREKILERPVAVPHSLYATERQKMIAEKMVSDMAKHLTDDKNPLMTGKLGKDIDLKRQFYRFPEQLLTNLGFYFNLVKQNTYKIAGLLRKRGFFSAEITNTLQTWMNYATSLRLKQQAHAKKQGFKIPVSLEEYNDGTDDLLKEIDCQERVIRLYEITKTDPEQLGKERAKLTELQKALKTHKKHKPAQEDSILSKAELTKLELFLPKCRDIFNRTLAFVQGDPNAFKN